MHLIEAALFDVDGVLAFPELLSQYYARLYGGDTAALNQFFVDNLPALRVGHADLKALMRANPSLWASVTDIDQFLHEWLVAADVRNQLLLDLIQDMRQRGIKCYAATNQDAYRAAYLKDTAYKETLDGYFISSDMGLAKPDPAYFAAIIKDLAIEPSHIVFFDDDAKNVAAARHAGVQAYVYESLDDVANVVDGIAR